MGICRRPGPCTRAQEAIPSTIPRQTGPITGHITGDFAPTFSFCFFHQSPPSTSLLCFLLQFLFSFFLQVFFSVSSIDFLHLFHPLLSFLILQFMAKCTSLSIPFNIPISIS